VLNPLATSSTVGCPEFRCQNHENITSGAGGANPWGSNGGNNVYSSVGKNSSLTYSFANSTSLSFLWGTADGSRNDLIFTLSDGSGTVALNAASLGVTGTKFVTISDVGVFNQVTFASDQRAFEYANVSASPVPLPAALPLLIAGVAGLGFFGRKRASA